MPRIDPTPAAAPSAALAAAAAYCCRCGYSLRGLPTGNCPECGGPFDLADRRTFAPRAPRSRLRRWIWRVSILAAILTLAAASVPGWYWWHWRAEQKVIAELSGMGATVQVKRVEPEGLAKYLPARWAFLHDGAWFVKADDLTVKQVERIDFGALAYPEYLELLRCHIGEPTLAQLRGLAELETLCLYRCRWDGRGLAHLAGCRKLAILELGETRVDDGGLRDVGRLTSLTLLGIDGTDVTDAGMDHLAGLTSLHTLDLARTAVTDAGLLQLRGLASLRSIDADNANVTAQGVRDLRKFLPNVKVFR